MINLIKILLLVFFLSLSGALYSDSKNSQSNGKLGPVQSIADKKKLKNFLICNELKKKYNTYKYYKKNLVFPINNIEIAENYNKLSKTMRDLAATCQNSRFKTCFNKNKTSIDLKLLNKLFTEWTKNYRFKHSFKSNSSYLWTQSLAYELAQIGYNAHLMKIEHSPFFLVYDSNTKNYFNIDSGHTVIQIKVKDPKVTNNSYVYILDTQFMKRPMEISEYFVKTVGQVCIKDNSFSLMNEKSLLNCYFSLHNQNASFNDKEPLPLLALKEDSMSCGWHYNINDIHKKSKSYPMTGTKFTLVKKINGKNTKDNNIDMMSEAYSNYSSILNLLSSNLKNQISEITDSLTQDVYFSKKDRDLDIERMKTYEKKLLSIKKDIAGLTDKVSEIKKILTNFYRGDNPASKGP